MRVESSEDFRRIVAIPRRAPEISDELVGGLTEALKTPQGTMRLKPVQALALHDIGVYGGLLGPMRVGSGKTLVTLLASVVLFAQRPVLIVPAALVAKTETERRSLSAHWQVARNLRIISYESLGRVSGATLLDRPGMEPDLIILDEAHRLKNPRAACTRRFTRFMREHPLCKLVAMSGTLIKKSIKDFAHLATFALKHNAPVPAKWPELELWSNALDEKPQYLTRVHPGVLGADIEQARQWFRDRLLQTPGVVSAESSGDADCALSVTGVTYQVNETTEANFTMLRELWQTPDGYTYSMATDIWRHARELALGLHYAWDPYAPPEWLLARREWSSFVRETIKDRMYANEPLDSELQVTNAVLAGKIFDEGLLEAWKAAKPTFEVRSVPRWHDDSALEFCERWSEENVGIIWVEHAFFGAELARRTGASYYGAGDCPAPSGARIEDEKGERTIIAP